VILYECLTGERPFSAKTDNEIFSQVTDFIPLPPSKLNSDLPAAFDNIVMKALAKEPDARYQSAADLLEDLREVRNSLLAQHDWRVVSVTTVSMVICLALLAYFVVLPRLRGYRAPRDAMDWYDKGTTALRNGAYFEASKAFQRAIGIDDNFALAHARLAEAYSELDYTDKAKDEIIRAESLAHELPLQPADALYLKALSNTVLRDFPPAIQSYQQIARQAQDHEKANVYLDLGRAYEKNDDLARAKQNYQEATQMSPQEASGFLRLGVVCGLQQNFSCAAEAFQKAESLYQSLGNLEGVTEVSYQRGLLFIFQIKPPEGSAQQDFRTRRPYGPSATASNRSDTVGARQRHRESSNEWPGMARQHISAARRLQ
jgi:tetratricopeptide (TPR) repeat protein